MPKQNQFEVDPSKPFGEAAYLLHFDEPYKHARHYLGGTTCLAKRIAHHRNGTGARLTRAVAKAGIHITVARTWKGGFAKEKELRRGRNNKRLCPICKGETDAKLHSSAQTEETAVPMQEM